MTLKRKYLDFYCARDMCSRYKIRGPDGGTVFTLSPAQIAVNTDERFDSDF